MSSLKVLSEKQQTPLINKLEITTRRQGYKKVIIFSWPREQFFVKGNISEQSLGPGIENEGKNLKN